MRFCIQFLVVFLGGLFFSCTSESDNSKGDKLLTDTKWCRNIIHVPPQVEIVDHEMIDDIVQLLRGTIPSVVGSIKIDCIERTEEMISLGDTTIVEMLTFGGDDCKYENMIEVPQITSLVRNRYKRMFMPSQECRENGYILKVNTNGIYLGKEGNDSNLQDYTLLLKLRDNVFEEHVKLLEVLSRQVDTIRQEIFNSMFDYERRDDEIVMIKNEVKWIGLLNKDKWEISLSQMTPTQKEIGVFVLNKD